MLGRVRGAIQAIRDCNDAADKQRILDAELKRQRDIANDNKLHGGYRKQTMIDIVDRLRFDAVRCELQFSKGVAGNINEAADQIELLRKEKEFNRDQYRAEIERLTAENERLRAALEEILSFERTEHNFALFDIAARAYQQKTTENIEGDGGSRR